MTIDRLVPVSNLCEPVRHRGHSEILWIAARNFVPAERSRDPGVVGRPDGVGRSHGPIFRILIVVDEDAVPLLFPPLARGDFRSPPLDLPREGKRRAADLVKTPALLDPHDNVHAAG